MFNSSFPPGLGTVEKNAGAYTIARSLAGQKVRRAGRLNAVIEVIYEDRRAVQVNSDLIELERGLRVKGAWRDKQPQHEKSK